MEIVTIANLYYITLCNHLFFIEAIQISNVTERDSYLRYSYIN